MAGEASDAPSVAIAGAWAGCDGGNATECSGHVMTRDVAGTSSSALPPVCESSCMSRGELLSDEVGDAGGVEWSAASSASHQEGSQANQPI